MNNDLARVDVSVVLNCHRENFYLKTSLDSIIHALEEANERGISTELIIVLDKPSEEVRAIINDCHFKHVSFEVSFGSLGLARNYGIAKACGKYIMTADADDLISSNMLYAMFEAAELYRMRNKKDCCLIPEFYYSFGNFKTLCKYYASKYFSPSDLVAYHPFVSRIFTTTDILREISYKDLNKQSGFSFEDWDLNSILYANGIDILPAKDTVLFYRQRDGSIMASCDYIRIPPLRELCDPKTFLNLSVQYRRPKDFHECTSSNVILDFTNNQSLMTFLSEANMLDPSIDVDLSLSSFSSVGKNLDCIFPHWGYRLSLLLRLTGTELYDDVFLLPWLEPGGAEKFILQIMEQISQLDPGRRVLVMTVEETEGKNLWKQKLPDNALFLDLFPFIHDLSFKDQLSLTTRLLLSVGNNFGNLHFKSSNFLDDLLNAYGVTLAKKYRIFKYLFCIPLVQVGKKLYWSTTNIERIRKEAEFVYKFISDNETISKRFISLLGKPYKNKFCTVYAWVEIQRRRKILYGKTAKFIWASRICKQKRIELLNEIARILEIQNRDIVIEVFGRKERGAELKLSGKLFYKGEFSNFSEIDLRDYRGLIYTSNFDGIPNVVLEAMSEGLPVISSVSAFSGLSEILNDQTGWLVKNSFNDKVCANDYVNACLDLLSSNEQEVKKRVDNGIDVLMERHSKSAQKKRIMEIFQIKETKELLDSENEWNLLRGHFISCLESLKQPINYFALGSFIPKNEIRLSQSEFALKYDQISPYVKNKTSLVYKISVLLADFPTLYKIAKKVYRLRFLLKFKSWI